MVMQMERQPTSHTKRPRARSRAKTKKKSKRGKKSNTSPHKHQQTSSKTGKQKIESTGRRRKAEARSVVTQHCVPDNQQRVQKAQKTQQQSGTESSHSKRKKKKKESARGGDVLGLCLWFCPSKNQDRGKRTEMQCPMLPIITDPNAEHHTSHITNTEVAGMWWVVLGHVACLLGVFSPIFPPVLSKLGQETQPG